ncbi:hypothetical protein FH972_025044 [Carpinus fangiana]|uniref:Patatin n=1 Tax=Carpinus fangiana TaxID=176857 RepID=A0A5N6L2D6_9ROSI|nr:hypothetical protein FH972_025044 [Carpinus fangiana]
MTTYARLPPEPPRKEPQIDIFPDVTEGDSKRGINNYLDEFLSAIKVFGYLERPVFHELTRTMQTKKLIAGETILLEEEQGFCLVVDGLVQIFVKSRRDDRSDTSGNASQDDDEGHESRDHQGYQLLTEVRNGAPLSSLFSILSLFTEGVKLRYDDDSNHSRPQTADNLRTRPPSVSVQGDGSFTPYMGTPNMESGPASPQRFGRQGRVPSSTNIHGADSTVPPFSLDSEVNEHPQKHTSYHGAAPRRKSASAHPDIVARASVDTTIAIIPATAFRRLTRIYPKASSHIVQVILTRLQRVTLTTAHAYLGLTSEVLRSEKLMNRYTTYDLPGLLRGSALDRLKTKFAQEMERIPPEDGSKGIALHNPRARDRRRSSTGIRRDVAIRGLTPSGRNPENPDLSQRVRSPGPEGNAVNAGDLLMNADQAQRGDRKNRMSMSTPFQTGDMSEREVANAAYVASARAAFQNHRQESLDEDSLFRESIAECMLKAIGLTSETAMMQGDHSVEQSPRLVSYDSRRQKAIFNSFGMMGPFDTDGDSASMISAPDSTMSSSWASGNILEELKDDIEIVYFPKDSVLVEQGERNPGLYYVIDGFVDVSVPVDESNNTANPTRGSRGPERDAYFSTQDPFRLPTEANSKAHGDESSKKAQRNSLYLTKPGGLAGYLGTISSRRSFVDVTAKTDVYVGFLPRASIERIVEKHPIVLLTMAKRLTSLLPRLILHIDFALEWVQIDAGQSIYRQGDDSDAIYIVLNGRLRSLQDGEGGKRHVIGEYGQGDSVGELEVLTESTRPGTLHAIRDTELAKLPKSLFNSLALENPEITIKISKIIAMRMRDLTENHTLEATRDRVARDPNILSTSTANLRTVAVLPVTSGVPVAEFATRLLSALSQIGTTNGATVLNHAAILKHLGRHAFNRMGKLKLSQHLADLEEKFGLVLYVADTNVNSPWTATCISQADCILLVGLAEGSPDIGEYERLLLTTKTTARKELVLLHSARYCPSGLTRKWLRNRMWINGSHHHVHMSFRHASEPVHPQTRRFGTALKQRVQVLQAEIQKYTSRRVRETPLYSAETPFKSDFHRLARRLIGKSVGLVLGGGGARGIAHIGIIRALEEAGIPIDIIGGTSIGAFVGALYAWDADMVPMYGRAKKFAGRMASMWRFALDLTYPTASYTTGHEFNRGIYKTFGTAQIEDFWLEFYCNTTNISRSRPEVHTSGYVWRYVRASMSLAGLVPPLCDEGQLLLDGGYLDNLTVAHMKSLGADVIFAVDVGAIDDDTPQNFGDSLSGFWAFWNRWNPLSSIVNPPTLSEIQARLAYVSSVDALERAKSMPGCRYMRPEVTDYGTLEFGKFDEIYGVGYKYGKEFLDELKRKGVLPVMEETEEKRKLRRTMAPRRASV